MLIRTSILRPYLTGGDVAATTATDQSRRLGLLGRPKIACALTKAETSPRLLPVYIYLDLQLGLSFDDVNTRSVTWSLKWVKQRQAGVAEKSLQRLLSLQQVSETSPQSPAGLGDVAGTSPQSLVKLVSATNGDVAETSPRPAGDWKKSKKKLNMFDFSATPRRPRLVSRRRRGDVSATSGDSSRQLVAN